MYKQQCNIPSFLSWHGRAKYISFTSVIPFNCGVWRAVTVPWEQRYPVEVAFGWRCNMCYLFKGIVHPKMDTDFLSSIKHKRRRFECLKRQKHKSNLALLDSLLNHQWISEQIRFLRLPQWLNQLIHLSTWL